MTWNDLLEEHRRATGEFVALARRIPEERWLVTRAEGKWCAGEELLHVRSAYDVANEELRGGAGMRPKAHPLLRPFIKLLYLPKILRTGSFPAVRAPREIRPDAERVRAIGRDRLIEGIVPAARAFEEALTERVQSGKRRRGLTHPYFGQVSCKDTLRFMIVHTRNHARHLEELVSGAGAAHRSDAMNSAR